MENKFFKKLPAVHQNDTQRKFFDATFEQLFSKKDSTKLDGYIGRRVSGNFNTIKDYYVPEINKDRTWYQLEPVALSTNPQDLSKQNISFYTDLVNRIRTSNGNVKNHDRLFSSNIYSYAPPIDVDKFINYQNYLWIPTKLSPVAIDLFDDSYINEFIIGSKNFVISAPGNVLDGMEFISGTRVQFTTSVSYNRAYTVEDSGKGLRLVPDEIEILAASILTPLPWDGDATVSGISLNNLLWDNNTWDSVEASANSQDYITIQRGSIDSNLWSRTNKWFHVSAIENTVKYTGEVIPRIAVRANRPIIEFFYNIELFDFGTHFLSEVDYVTGTWSALTPSVLRSDVNGQPLQNIRSISNLEGLEYTNRILFSDDNSVAASTTVSDYIWVATQGTTGVFFVPQGYTLAQNDISVANGMHYITTSSTVTVNSTVTGQETYIAKDNTNTVTINPVGGTVYDNNGALVSTPIVLTSVNSAKLVKTDTGWLYTEELNFVGYARENNNVLVVSGQTRSNGGNLGIFFNKQTGVWTESSNIKFTQNQPPLFNVYDNERSNLLNAVKYPFSDFAGNKIFSYSVDTSVNAINDRVLGFPIKYKGSTQGSDIIFENNFETNVYQYLSGSVLSDISGYYNYRLVDINNTEIDNNDWMFNNCWHLSDENSRQYLINKYAGIDNVNEYPVSAVPVDVDLSIIAYVSGVQYTDVDFFYVNTAPWVRINNAVITADDDIEIRVYTFDRVEDFASGFFEIPAQLEANPLNTEVTTITYGEINPHFLTIIGNQFAAEGDPRARSNNYLNTEKDLSKGTRILQTDSPMVKSMFVTSAKEIDVMESIFFAQREYTTFKSQFISACGRFIPNVGTLATTLWLSSWTKEVIASVNKSKNFSDAFALSGMFPMGDPTVSVSVSPSLLTESVEFLSVELNRPYIVSKTDVPYLDSRFCSFTVFDNSVLVDSSKYTISINNNVAFFTFTDPSLEFQDLVVFAEVASANITGVTFDTSLHNNYISAYSVSANNGVYARQTMLLNGVDYETEFDYFEKIYTKPQYVNTQIIVNAFNNSVPSYIPATPSKLGMYQSYVPALTVDKSGITERAVIIGHDGSKTKAYTAFQTNVNGTIVTDPNGTPIPLGLTVATTVNDVIFSDLVKYFDIRDLLLLEYEKTVYSNILPKFKNDYIPVYSTAIISPTAFRDESQVRYSLPEITDIIAPDLAKWCAVYKLDLYTNQYFDISNWKTYNYFNNKLPLWDADTLSWAESTIDSPGNWKGIYNFYYSTYTPDVSPWELLGFSTSPSWWNECYDDGDGFTGYGFDYSDANVAMWADLEQGIIRRGNRKGVYEMYARNGLTGDCPVQTLVAANGNILRAPYTGAIGTNNIIPVTSTGIRTVSDLFGLVDADDGQWDIGDFSPVEATWTESSEYVFSLMNIMFLAKPGLFGEQMWDTENKAIVFGQVINAITQKRSDPANYLVHGEEFNGDKITRVGYQHYISDFLNFNKISVTLNFGERFRNLKVELGNKLAGFVNYSTTKLYLESATSLQSTGDLLIPNTNYDVILHTGAPIKTYSYSGVVFRKVDTGFKIYGYDLNQMYFNFLPADRNSRQFKVTEGGVAASFVEYEFNVSYKQGTIVRYNGRFYVANVDVNSSSFSTLHWDPLPALPIVNGVSAVYYPDRTDTVLKVPYGTVFTNVQDMYDFLIGYGEWLTSDGWLFDTVSDTGTIDNWKSSASKLLFWLASGKMNNETLMLSPNSTSLSLEVSHGYPSPIEKLNNGVYSIVDKNGIAIPPNKTFINRDGKKISVITENTGVYGLRINAAETEHVLVVDQISDFNDVIYSPLLRSRQGRLRLVCTKSNGWFGKLEAPGYLIQGNTLIQNADNIVDSFQNFYSDSETLDNPFISDAARRLIGYDQKDYLNRLSVTDDVQFNFYQGYIRQKGSLNSISKILRSNKISNKDRIDIFEEWAVNSSHYGGTQENISVEFASLFNNIKSDPQVFRLNYLLSNELYVNTIEIYNSSEIYTVAPTIIISAPLSGTTATAKALLGPNRKLGRIVVTNPGSGYTSVPTVTISGDFIPAADGLIVNGQYVNRDVAFAVTKNTVIIEDSPYDNIVDIDVNDTSAWLYSSVDTLTNTVPMVAEYLSDIPNSGYVHRDDVNFEIFRNLEDLNSLPAVSNSSVVHLANDLHGDWDICKFTTGTGLSLALVDGRIVVSGVTNPVIGTSIFDLNNRFTNARFKDDLSIVSFYIMHNSTVYFVEFSDEAGEYVVYANGEELTELVNMSGLVYVPYSLRYRTDEDLQLDAGVLTTDLVYVDNYADTGWAVLRNDVILRKQSMLIDTTKFSAINLRDTQGSLVTSLPVYDPVKGILPALVDMNVNYRSFTDPARYNNSNNELLISEQSMYGIKNVGQVWLDLSSFKFINYELPASNTETLNDELEYRRANWGRVFPGSEVNVYEWIESNVLPSEYTGEGSPKNTTDFVEIRTFNPALNEFEVKYYYWVKDLTTVPVTANQRTASVISVRNLIRNPAAYRFNFFAPVQAVNGSVSIAIANSEEFISKKNLVIELNYRTNEYTQNNHAEWQLLAANRFNNFPTFLWDKLTDSMVGYTQSYDIEFEGTKIITDSGIVLPVPNPSVSDINKYGLGIRPQQSMFVNRTAAKNVIITYINQSLAEMQLWQSMFGEWQTELQPYGYWSLIDWFAEGFNTSNTIAKRQVEDTQGLLDIESELSTGDLVRVYPFNPVPGEFYEVYQYTGDEFVLVRRESGTFAISELLINESKSSFANAALRGIMQVLIDNIFISGYRNIVQNVFFTSLNYAVSEQRNLTWAFKTSYISIAQEGKSLDKPLYLQPDQLTEYLSYVNDVKPYHTKIRDVYVTYLTNEEVNGTVLDNYVGEYDPSTNIASTDFEALKSIKVGIVFDDFTRNDQIITNEHGWDTHPWDSNNQSLLISKGVLLPTQTSLLWDQSPDSASLIINSEGNDFIIDGTRSSSNELVEVTPSESLVMYVENDVREAGLWNESPWDSTPWDYISEEREVKYVIHASHKNALPNYNRDYYAISDLYSTELVYDVLPGSDIIVNSVDKIQSLGDHALWIKGELVKYNSYIQVAPQEYKLLNVQRGWNSTGVNALHIAGTTAYDYTYNVTLNSEQQIIYGPGNIDHTQGSQVTTTDEGEIVPITNPWFGLAEIDGNMTLVAASAFSKRLFLK